MNRPNLQAKTVILRALRNVGQSAGAAKIQEQLKAMGASLQPCTIRFYLFQLDREGLTRLVSRRAGRELTAAGQQELGSTPASSGRAAAMVKHGRISSALKRAVDGLRDWRNREHLFLLNEREYKKYTLKHYNDGTC